MRSPVAMAGSSASRWAGVPSAAHQRGAEDGGGEVGLDDERLPHGAHGEEGLHRGRRHPALLLRDLKGQQPHLAQLPPDLPAPPLGGAQDLPARVEGVLLREEALDHVGEGALLVGEVEVHGVGP